MLNIKFNLNQTKLGIKSLDQNIQGDHISCFVVEFNDDVFPRLETDQEEKNTGKESIHLDSLLKFIVMLKFKIYGVLK